MSEQTTYIKLDRRILSWGWYKDGSTFRVFVHLLLKANYKESNFMGVRIHRGCAVASYKSIAEETGLNIGQVRSAVEHLKKTGEVEAKHHRSFTVFRIINYAEYQDGKVKKEKQKPKPKTNPMGVYGVNGNVKLTDAEFTKLADEYVDYEDVINRVSAWLVEGTHSKARKHYELCVKFAGDKTEKNDPRTTIYKADGTFIQDGVVYRKTEEGLEEIGRMF